MFEKQFDPVEAMADLNRLDNTLLVGLSGTGKTVSTKLLKTSNLGDF